MTQTATQVRITPQNDVRGTLDTFEEFSGEYGPSYRLTVQTTDFELVSFIEKKDKVDKELGRLGTNINAALGQDFRFWKKPTPQDPTKGYFNIDRLTAAAAVPSAPAPTRAGEPRARSREEASPSWQSAAEGYSDTLTYVVTNVVPVLTELEIPVTAEAINSIVATIRIEASKAR